MGVQDGPRATGELAPGVFWVEQSVLQGKNGVVIGTRGALGIDSGNSAADGEAVAGLIRSQGRAPDRLALTHGHGDHVIGSSAFRGAEVFAHTQTPVVMRRKLPSLVEIYARPALAGELTWPTVTFGGELLIDLGGKTVRLFPTPGHSEDSTCAFVLEDRILFSGDTAVTAVTPVIGDGDSRQLEASLYQLCALGAETLVPGHGPVVYGRAAVRDTLLWAAGYLAAVRARARELLQEGAETGTVVEACGLDEFVGDHSAIDRSRLEKPHRFTTQKIVDEVRGELGMASGVTLGTAGAAR